MQQMVITYVLSGLANIADVNPRDVHTSLFNGNVRVNNLALRPETMNKILPLPIEEGTVPEMEVQIPNPSTAAPMDVKVRRARLLLQFDLSSPAPDRTPEQIQRGITADAILGHAAAQDVVVETASETASEPRSPTVSEPEEAAHGDFSSANSEVDEEDFKSCASDGDVSDSESTSGFGSRSTSDDEPASPNAQGGGWFGYLRSRAAQSVEWVWRRQVRVSFTDLTMVLPCDARKNIHYEIAIETFTVMIEPTQTTGTEQMKIVNLEIGGATVFANAGDARSRILVVEALAVKITTVYEVNTERTLRKNVVVSFNGTNTLTADEATLFALLKCHLSRQTRLSVPSYCLPFATLRARGSLWPYTKNCVLQGLRDYKQRYNFNASYLRFYAQARERYLQLLNECHRCQSVMERRQQLVDAEQDLRHEDVILCLRRLVQAKFAANVAELSTDDAAELDPLIVSSTHFEWKLVKIVLPSRNTVYVRHTALIFRNEEKIFTVNSISLDADGFVQTVAAPAASAVSIAAEAAAAKLDEEHALLYMHEREDQSSKETKVSLQRVALKGSVEGALRCVTPIAEALQRVAEQSRTGATTPMTPPAASSAAAPPPTPVQKPATSILAVHYVEVQLDDFQILVDHLSCTTADAPGTPPRLACTARRVHIRHRDAFVLAPLEVRMTPRGSVVVSRVSLQIPRETWAALRKDADSIRLLYEKYPRFDSGAAASSASADKSSSGNSAATAAGVQSNDIDLSAMKGLERVLQWSPVSSCPPLEVEDIAVVFHPLDCTVTCQRVSVQTVAAASRGPYGTHVAVRRMSVQCHYTKRMSFRLELGGGLRVGMSPEPAQAMVVTFPDMSITGRRANEAEDLSLLTLGDVEGVVHGTVQYYIVRHVLAASGVRVEDAELIYKTDASVPLFNDRPCLTSYMQVAAVVKSIDVEKLSGIPTRAVSYVLGEMYAFICEEMVPENYYRTFFSCFSDMALQIRMHECVVRCGADDRAEELLVSLANTTSESRLAALNVYRPHLLASTDDFPILVLNDVGRLSMQVDVSCLALQVSARPAVSPSNVTVTVSGMKMQMALEKMPFWRTEALEIPAVPQKWAVDAVRVVARLDPHASAAPVLDASLTAFTMETATGPAWGSGGSPGQSMARDLPLSPSESDRGSCASSTDEELETTQVGLRRWNLSVDFSQPLSEFYKLQHMTRSIVNAAECFSRRVVLRQSVSAMEFHLDDCGDLFLDAPTQMLLVQDCTFYAPSADRHIVVCPGTSAIFRGCTFVQVPNAAELIRTAARSALYFCEDCRATADAASLSSSTSPTVANAPTSAAAGSPGAVSEVPLHRRLRTQLAIDEGGITVHLDATSRLVCTQKALSLNRKRKTRRTFVKGRNAELRVEYVDAEQRVPVLAKTVVEGELAMQLPRRSCTGSCSLNCGDIVLPVVTAKMQAVLERLAILRESTNIAAAPADEVSESSTDVPATSYAVPPPPPPASDSHTSPLTTHDRFPYDSWKVLLSLSLIPITVQLPGGMKVAKVTFSNAFVWSKREPLAEAQVEARIALHDMALWEWQRQTYQSVISAPVFLGVQGRTTTPLHLNLTATISPVDAAVSTDQMKLLLHALQAYGAQSTDSSMDGRQAAAQASFVWHNYAGVALRARSGDGSQIALPSANSAKEQTTCLSATAPFNVTEVDGVGVDHVERDMSRDDLAATHEACDDATPPPLFTSRQVVVLADKRRLHITSSLTPALVQEIAVRTAVQVQNSTPFSLTLTAASQPEHAIAPFGLSCVPDGMLSCADLSVSVVKGCSSSAFTPVSLREPLFPESITAGDFYQRCYQQGFPAADMAREFVSQLDGSSTFMATHFEMHGAVLLLVFRSARPHVVNDTVYPVLVDAVSARGEVLASERIEAGARAFFFGLSPSMPVRANLRLLVEEEVYVARDTVPLFDRDAAAVDSNVVLAHSAHPRRYFFEVNLSVAESSPAGPHGIAITAEHLCLVKNCTSVDLFFSTEEGDAVGTMGVEGLRGSGDRGSVGYVPSNAVLCIKPKGAALSEVFEIDSSGEGCVIQCDHAPEASPFSALFFLLHMVPGPRAKLAELLPSIVFRNRHRRRILCIKHVIRQTGSTRTLEETILEVSPQSDHPYYTLSKYGYTNDLLFAWKDAEAAAGSQEQQQFSSVVETDLAPSTTWSGFICCGATHHQVDVAKGHLYEPAYVTVGPAVLPRVKLVNLTATTFREVANHEVAFPQPSKNNKYLFLTTAEGTLHTVDLLQEEPVELEPGLTVQTVQADEDRSCVVLSNGRLFVTLDKSWASEVQFSMNVQMTALLLRLRDGNAVPLQLLWRSFATNVMWWSGMTSLQSSVTGICLESNYEGRKQQVVEPFDADVSVREMRSTSRDVYLKGFYIGLQPLAITVSDVLLYQLQVVGSRCRVPVPFCVLSWVRQPASVSVLRSLPASLPQLLHIGSAGISETPLELSWDRSTRPPQDFLLGDSAISKLIPSLHHALLVIPKLQLRNVSRVSLGELMGRIQQILLMEVVKQIPKMVTTVSLFRKNSSLLEKVTSTVSSLLFRSARETNTTDDGSSALI